MTSTTTRHAYPYPTDGDLLTQTDEAIQALAEALDPLGRIGEVTRTTDLVTTTGATDLFNITVNNIPANRRIRVSAVYRVDATAAGDVSRGAIKMDGGQVQLLDCVLPTANVGNTVYGFVLLTPSAGNHNFSLNVGRVLGSGTMTARCTATNPGHFLIEDLGPN